jgi:16S rRNA (adenine1518-N6/adenine1519-N6)-dimethyltransferase
MTRRWTRPRRRLGQHFLEPAWAAKVIDAIGPGSDDTFLEIGPGRGALTWPLAARARWVAAYEIDRDLAARLRQAAPANLTVIEGDFLDASGESIRRATGSARAVRIAGNLPYNAAAPMLFKLVGLHAAGLPAVDATLMLQLEVADRLAAAPGTREYGILTILIGRQAGIERLLVLPPGAFRPSPKVRSALVRLRFHPPQHLCTDEGLFVRLVQTVFTRRRKMLRNALTAVLRSPDLRSPVGPPSIDELLAQAGIDGRRRPETLSLAELVRLADGLAGAGRAPTRRPPVL